MANRTRMIRRRKAPRRKKEPDIMERLKKLSDSAPVTRLPGGKFDFYKDHEDAESKDK